MLGEEQTFGADSKLPVCEREIDVRDKKIKSVRNCTQLKHCTLLT